MARLSVSAESGSENLAAAEPEGEKRPSMGPGCHLGDARRPMADTHGEIAGSGVHPQHTREQGSAHESGSSMRMARRTGADSGGWYHGDITRVAFAAYIRPGAGELMASPGHLLHLFVRSRSSVPWAANTIDPRAHPRSHDAVRS